MKYAVYKTLTLSAKEIVDCIQSCRDMDDVEITIYRDGWIVAEPKNLVVYPWSRNKDDYRFETI